MIGLAIVPCVWVFWTLAGLFTAFLLTILCGHHDSWIMLISDTGSHFPESTVFTVVFSGCAMLGSAIVYIRYRFMYLRDVDSEKHQLLLQRILLGMGFISNFGILTQAIYPMVSDPIFHRTGATLAFGFGAAYNIIQSVKLYSKSFSSRPVCHIRMICSVVMGTSIFMFAAFMAPVQLDLCNGEICIQICTVTAISYEWLAAATYMINNITYVTDFQRLCIEKQGNGYAITLRTQIPDCV